MPTLRQLPGAVRHRATKQLKTRLVKSGRVPRYAYRHYYIEDEGLHSRIHLQNFYSVMWPHLEEYATVRVEAFAENGTGIGDRTYQLAPFGGLYLDMSDLLESIGSASKEGTVLVDVEPPASVLADLTSFPLPDQWELIMGTPFWMAFYDDDENYMYVHSISPEMSRYYGVPRSLGKLFIREGEAPGGRWRAGRLLDVAGLSDLQIVLLNHAGSERHTEIGVFDADGDAPVWVTQTELAPHQVRRLRVPEAALASFRAMKPNGRFRVGMDSIPTSNGKPYLLMRYGDGPLSLHHG